MIRWTALSIVALLAIASVHAQSKQPAFDVASVKPSSGCQPGMRASISPRNFAMPCATLRRLIQLAYGDLLIGTGMGARIIDVNGGPGWLDTDHYDILAKSDTTEPSAAPMLRTLLEDRFKVKVHREGKETSVYILSVANGGPKLNPAKAGSCVAMDAGNLPAPSKPGETNPHYCGMPSGSRNGATMVMDWYGTTAAEVAGRILNTLVELPVVDQTHLTGRYDIHLEFVPERRTPGPAMVDGVPRTDLQTPAADPAGGPSIFTALEKQLGLKLTAGKTSVDVIVVDRAEKPTAN